MNADRAERGRKQIKVTGQTRTRSEPSFSAEHLKTFRYSFHEEEEQKQEQEEEAGAAMQSLRA